MNTNDVLGAIVIGAVAYKMLEDDKHHNHKKEKKQKGLLF